MVRKEVVIPLLGGATLLGFIFGNRILPHKNVAGPHTIAAGEDKTLKTNALELGAAMMQSHAPLKGYTTYMVGFHPMKNHPDHQMEAHHYCKQVTQDVAECALFDGNTPDAHLTGIEYIISEGLYKTLSDKEKQLWHPHSYEVLSGTLVAPGIPETAEYELMRDKLNTYGKTYHVWNTGHFGLGDAQTIPVGEPMLAWSFNQDGEINPGLLRETADRLGIDFEHRRQQRVSLRKHAHPQCGVEALQSFFGKLKTIEGVVDCKREHK
jgi:hypothetical protein